MTNLLNQLTKDFNLTSSQARKALENELKQVKECNGWQDLNGLTETIYHYLKNQEAARDEMYPEYKQIRNYLDSVKIKYSQADKAEFSDDWNRIKCIIGLKTLSSKEGQEVTTALKELNEICGRVFDSECNTQFGFIQLVSYLQNIPSKYDCFIKSLQVNGYDLPGMIKEAAARPEVKAAAYRIEENKQYNSKEIYFEKMPSKQTRENLKKLRFRWHNLKKCWYGFATMEAIKAAC